tara:strand:- start:1976 stop:2926 length:951 start_codon:yes stop_codon:yes gene_type:complete
MAAPHRGGGKKQPRGFARLGDLRGETRRPDIVEAAKRRNFTEQPSVSGVSLNSPVAVLQASLNRLKYENLRDEEAEVIDDPSVKAGAFPTSTRSIGKFCQEYIHSGDDLPEVDNYVLVNVFKPKRQELRAFARDMYNQYNNEVTTSGREPYGYHRRQGRDYRYLQQSYFSAPMLRFTVMGEREDVNARATLVEFVRFLRWCVEPVAIGKWNARFEFNLKGVDDSPIKYQSIIDLLGMLRKVPLRVDVRSNRPAVMRDFITQIPKVCSGNAWVGFELSLSSVGTDDPVELPGTLLKHLQPQGVPWTLALTLEGLTLT